MVIVVDDDPSLREALGSLLRSVGLRVELFGSAPELLQTKLPDVASCLVLDIRLPKRSGLDFQAELARTHADIPTIFITGHGDVPMSVKAMKAGASNSSPSRCASKPCLMPCTTRSNAIGCDGSRPRNCATLGPASSR